jgi:hypothetical protein
MFVFIHGMKWQGLGHGESLDSEQFSNAQFANFEQTFTVR